MRARRCASALLHGHFVNRGVRGFHCGSAVYEEDDVQLDELVALTFPLLDRYRADLYCVPNLQHAAKSHLGADMDPRRQNEAVHECRVAPALDEVRMHDAG